MANQEYCQGCESSKIVQHYVKQAQRALAKADIPQVGNLLNQMAKELE